MLSFLSPIFGKSQPATPTPEAPAPAEPETPAASPWQPHPDVLTGRIAPHLGRDSIPILSWRGSVPVVTIGVTGPVDPSRSQTAIAFAQDDARAAAIATIRASDEAKALSKAMDREELARSRHEDAVKQLRAVREKRKSLLEQDEIDSEELHKLAVAEEDARRREQSTKADLAIFARPVHEAYNKLREKARNLATAALTTRRVELLRRRNELREAIVTAIPAAELERFVLLELAAQYLISESNGGYFISSAVDQSCPPIPEGYTPPRPASGDGGRMHLPPFDGSMPAMRQPGAEIVSVDADGRPNHVRIPSSTPLDHDDE